LPSFDNLAASSVTSKAVAHHPVLERFTLWRGYVDPGWNVNFLGVLTRTAFTDGMGSDAPGETHGGGAGVNHFVETSYPGFGEEYFEWIDVLESVVAAEQRFTMVELGAGWGRWLINAAAAARQRGLDVCLVGVEAEPTHFGWMQQHFRDNGIDPKSNRLIKAAVASTEGRVRFHIGDPSSWYGQAIDPNQPRADQQSLLKKARSLVGRRKSPAERQIVEMRAVTLPVILSELDRVDLIDLDVQGVEAEVLEGAEHVLSEKVARVHIGTHSEENEQRSRALFARLGWENLNDYASGTTAATPWGSITFQDGVQTWRNPVALRAT
jgi:FkbM family methyltransferase